MPPRIPLFQCLKTPNATQHPSYTRPFTSSASRGASTVTQRRRHQDPYAIAQAKARKAANISKQEVLRKERAASLGDPIRGVTTPLLQSFDSPTSTESEPSSQSEGKEEPLNYFLTPSELEKGLQHSQWLSTPTPAQPSDQSQETDDNPSSNNIFQQDFDTDFDDDLTPAQRLAKQAEAQSTANEAVRRISSLTLGNSKDRLRVNIQRCVSSFGRHTTDSTLPPRPPSIQAPTAIDETTGLRTERLPKTPRAGPDTGSSEVQIAILTAKIRTLADFLETRGRMDKANKRNLRLLVHRRAKLLKYLRRKERAGPRWANLIESLGLTEGTWKGEITLMGPLGGHSAGRLAKVLGKMEK